jgi:mannan endo-1,4-beta-mannosidase
MATYYARMKQVVMPAAPASEPVLVLESNKRLTVRGFRVVKTGAASRQDTAVALTWDPDGLTAEFTCSDADIVADQKGPCNAKLWKDDCVYLWLDPWHSHDGKQEHVMIQVSAGGETFIQREGKAESELKGLVCTAETDDGGWRAAIRLSWAALDRAAPEPGDVWGFNLTRMDQPGKFDYENMEMSSLVGLADGELAHLDAWGHLVFITAQEDSKSGAREMAIARKAMERIHGRRIDRLGVAYYRELLLRKREDEDLDARRGLPANPRATPDACKVLRYLTGLTERNDKRFLLAQDIWSYEGGLDGGYDRFVAKLAGKTGKWLPMLHVSYPDSSVSPEGNGKVCADANRHAIAYWKAGGLVTIHTNPVNPWTGKYDLAHRENLANVIRAGTPENLAWMRSLDALASHLTLLREAGVVVLWRPLHEMTFTNCYWYDCGATPDREVFKDLWRFMFRYFTCEKGLDNLLWVYSASDVGSWNGPAPDSVYPGGDYVDIVGISLYGNSVQIDGGAYEKLVALGKPFAFSEFGPGHTGGAEGMKTDSAKPFDNMTLIRQVREKYPRAIYAAYWHSWPGASMAIVDNPNADQLFSDPWVASRDDVDWKSV